MRYLSLFMLGALSLSAQITYRSNLQQNTPDSSFDNTVSAPAITVTANDLILVYVGRFQSSGASVSGVVCGSDTLTQAASSNDAAGIGQLDLWYKSGATAGGSVVCTATLSTNAQFRLISALSYGGIATASALDKTSCDSVGCSGGTTATTRTAQNTATTAQADELLAYGTYDAWTHTWTVQNSFNLRSSTTGADHIVADKTVSATGAYPGGNVATVDSQANNGYLAVFATFKSAAGGGGGPTFVRRRPIVQ